MCNERPNHLPKEKPMFVARHLAYVINMKRLGYPIHTTILDR